MSASIQQIKSALKSCRFESLFLELLGWDHLHKSAAQSISYRGQEYRFTPLAHKAEFKVYLHIFDGPLPAESLLKHLDRALDLHAVEHMTIFVDANKENQVWLWTKKVHGQTTRSRVNWLRKQESGERL